MDERNDERNRGGKVKVHFVAVGSAPILKQTKFQVASDQRFSSLNVFLRKVLKLPDSEALFMYCHSAFVPAPDHLLGDLKDAFAIRDELVIHYSLQEAWG
jgi:ubiquitin-like protein ATG12